MHDKLPIIDEYDVGGMLLKVEVQHKGTVDSFTQNTTFVCDELGLKIDGENYDEAVRKLRAAILEIFKGLEPEAIKRHHPAPKANTR